VADSQNYGDDVPAQDLVNPPAFSDMSISPYAMAELRPRQQIYDVFHRIGFQFNDKIFDQIYERASGGASYCTINNFRNALNDFIIQNELV
jgi:hypothetical protein